MLATPLLLAACSAAGFALSTSLQHRAAGQAPTEAAGTQRLLAHLAGRPWWVLGQVVAILSFALHALALQHGALTIVQPVVVSGIVLAVPVRAALERRLPSRGELGTVALTAAGLALFLVAARPGAGHFPTDPSSSVALTLAGAVTAAAATWWAGRCRTGERAALWFGVASGVLFGLVAGLVKLTTTTLDHLSSQTPGSNELTFLGLWSTWAVLVVGLCGVAVNQRAYRAARLSASMPVLNIVDVLVALVFGVAVFGEAPSHTPLAVAGQLVALACVAVGLRRLSHSGLFTGDVARPEPTGSRPRPASTPFDAREPCSPAASASSSTSAS